MKPIAALVLLLLPLAAFAAPPTEASIERLLALTEVEKNLVQGQRFSENMMRRNADIAIARAGGSVEKRQKLQETIDRAAKMMREELGYAKMKPHFTRVYSETFTQEEIDGLIAFYESPAGRAFTAKMPQVMQKTMAIVQEHMQPLMRKLDAEIRESAEAR